MMKLLIFWCAQFTSRNVDLLIRNVAHLREIGVQFDLLVGHYDEKKQLWLDRNETWYLENVKWGVDKPGFKVHLLKTIRDENLAGVDFDLANYDWVWMFDEDVEITNATNKLFHDAKLSEALIVGPSFVQNDPFVANAFEVPYYPMNSPQWTARYRYVPLVEIIMPLFRPEALIAFFDCETCFPPYNSDWGLDHIWCSAVERALQVPDRKTCAIVDHTGPIVHLNYGSTRKKKSANDVKSEGQLAEDWLLEHSGDDYRADHFHKLTSWEGYGDVRIEDEALQEQSEDALPAESPEEQKQPAEDALPAEGGEQDFISRDRVPDSERLPFTDE